MYPLGAEDNFRADAHYYLIKFVVTVVFGRSVGCIVGIVGGIEKPTEHLAVTFKEILWAAIDIG